MKIMMNEKLKQLESNNKKRTNTKMRQYFADIFRGADEITL